MTMDNENPTPKKKGDKIDMALIRLIEQELKAANDKLDWIVSVIPVVRQQPFNPSEPTVHITPIPPIPPLPIVGEDGQAIPSWEQKRIVEEKKPIVKKKSPRFKRLIIIMIILVLIAIFFRYGIAWIGYFMGGQ